MGAEAKNGKVHIDYRIEGRRYRETFPGSKKFGERVIAKRKTEAAEGRFFPQLQKQKLTFAQAADKYWSSHLSKKKSAPKLKYTLAAIKKYFGNQLIARITTDEVQQFYNKKLEETSPSTANRHFTTLRAVINKVIKLKLYRGENPCNGVDKEKENPARTSYLKTAAEIRDVLTFAPDRSKELIAFAIGTGMRQGEILRLEWNDIDFIKNIIHVHITKSGSPRDIPILASLRSVLLNMKPQTSGRVFPLSAKMVEHDFNLATKKAGISGIRFHDLRHTFASHFMMNGGSLPDLQRILGHSDLKLTQRYAHASPAYWQQSIKMVDNLIPSIQ